MIMLDQVVGDSLGCLWDYVEKYPQIARAALKEHFENYCQANADGFEEGMSQNAMWEEYIDWQRDEPYEVIEAIGWEIVKRRGIKAAVVDVNVEDVNQGPNEYEWAMRIYQIIPQTKDDFVELLENYGSDLPEVVVDHLIKD